MQACNEECMAYDDQENEMVRNLQNGLLATISEYLQVSRTSLEKVANNIYEARDNSSVVIDFTDVQYPHSYRDYLESGFFTSVVLQSVEVEADASKTLERGRNSLEAVMLVFYISFLAFSLSLMYRSYTRRHALVVQTRFLLLMLPLRVVKRMPRLDDML